MKKEMTLTADVNKTKAADTTIKNITGIVRQLILIISRYYSKVLDTEVSTRQTLLLINAQLAFFLTVFPIDCPLVIRLVCLAWLVSALIKCKNSGLRTSD